MLLRLLTCLVFQKTLERGSIYAVSQHLQYIRQGSQLKCEQKKLQYMLKIQMSSNKICQFFVYAIDFLTFWLIFRDKLKFWQEMLIRGTSLVVSFLRVKRVKKINKSTYFRVGISVMESIIFLRDIVRRKTRAKYLFSSHTCKEITFYTEMVT